jgi:integrase/recombinase XerC
VSYAKRAVRTLRTLSRAERRQVLATIGKARDGYRDFMIVTFALGTGVREGGILGLNVGDVADGPREVRSRIELRTFAKKGPRGAGAEPKTQRIFPSKIVRLHLRKYLAWKKREGESLAADAPLFATGPRSPEGAGARLSDRALRRMWRVWQVRAGFKPPLLTFHELRHTFATTLRARVGDLRIVQRALHHKHISSTQIYAHVSDDELRRALEDQES